MSRASGVLLHPTSLPGPWGQGDLGPEARKFAAWLGSAGQRVWQVLPLTPVDGSGSPYNSPSAFAGSAGLVSIDDLVADGWLEPDDPELLAFSEACAEGSPERIEHGLIRARREPLVRKAARALVASRGTDRFPDLEFERFTRAESEWLPDWARFYAAQQRSDGPCWEWSAATPHDPALVAEEVAVQFLFDVQWRRLRAVAAEHGVQILGDLPIFVSAHSAAVWAHPELFLLGEDGRPEVVAGVPPDAFSPTGQMWGMPLYDWSRNEADGFGWWCARLQAQLRRVDLVRVDHFRGFEAAWQIPADAEDAREGAWEPGPGAVLFKAFQRTVEAGRLPLIAEDLGVITPEVDALRDAFELPGMRILQFAFGGEPNHDYLPHTYPERCVVYPGTHDNDTALGWWNRIGPEERQRVEHYLGRAVTEPAWDLWRLAAESRAELAVVPAQDLLSLGEEARMNTPGLSDGNWAWRARPGAFDEHLAGRLAEVTTRSRRDGHRS